MNQDEATRYAHRLVADALARSVIDIAGPDGPKIARAVVRIVEQHRRFGPKSTDRAPRADAYQGERLPLELEAAPPAAAT